MNTIQTKTPKEKRSSFLSGVFLLSCSAVLVKLTGLLTKIPMLHLLGAQGMGYYNTAYEVYAALFVLSSAGLPVALSILVSRAERGRRRILRCAMYLFAAMGGIGCMILWLFADPISARIGNAGAGACMRALAPAVLFVCLSCGIRGYYQGLGDMRPTAISQVIESVGKTVFGVLFAFCARGAGAPRAQISAAGAWGLSVGTLLALIFLMVRISIDFARERTIAQEYITDRESHKRPPQAILRPLCAIAVPITVSAGITPLIRLLDMVLILRRLQGCGYTEEMTGSLYGIYSTLVIPLYSLLPMLIGSFALPLVPGITYARERGDLQTEREIVSTSLRLTCLLGLPASMGLSVFAEPILSLLFGGNRTDSAVMQAYPLLQVLGISVLGGCLVTVLGAMLQAYGCHKVPLYAMLVGAAVKLSVSWVLLGMPSVGMLGVPISTFLCHLTVILVESLVLGRRIAQGTLPVSFLGRTVFASLGAVGGTWLVWIGPMRALGEGRLWILPVVALCAGIYLLLILRIGAIRREDVMGLSHGNALWTMLIRLRLVRGGE